MKKNILSQGCSTGIDMIFAGIYKNELSVVNVFPSIQCFCLNISEMNRIESTSLLSTDNSWYFTLLHTQNIIPIKLEGDPSNPRFGTITSIKYKVEECD